MTSSAGRRTDGRAARWAGQRERRRRDFVDAALRAINKYGAEVSTEQIAEESGVARTQLYKYFADTSDLQHAIAERAVEQVNAELAPLWELHGTPMQMITSAIESHTGWMSEHGHLYRYLSIHSRPEAERAAAIDVKTAIARHLTLLFTHYLSMFGIDRRMAEPIAYGVVGLVDFSTARWMENPNDIAHGEFAGLLARWVWLILDDTLRTGGIELDPNTPLAIPELTFPPGPDSSATTEERPA